MLKTPEIHTTHYFEPLYIDKTQRYYVYFGGRAGRKSWEFAQALIMFAFYNPKSLILCAREIQNSISDSVLRLLSKTIERMQVSYFFDIQRTRIIGRNGSEFAFKGLNSETIDSLKSFEGADICWVEEAHSVSEKSWSVLIPTIRKPGSRFFISFNPDLSTDPVYHRFIINRPDRTIVQKVNYLQNPDCPSEAIEEAEYLKRVDYESYAHIWLGEVREHSDAQIFKDKYRIESFEVDETFGHPLFGADWGFANDPNTLVKVYIKDHKLYIRHELYKVGCEIKDTPAFFDRMPEIRDYTIRADSARPELIDYMKGEWFNIIRADKWPGCVIDRISFIRSFEEIIIHPDCVHTAEEFRLYSYKVDKRTGDILPDVVSLNDHIIDAIGYALTPLIKHNDYETFYVPDNMTL